MTELEHAIKHIKTRADAWAVKEVTEALQSISERLDKALSQEPCRVKNELNVELNELKPCTDAVSRESVLGAICDYVAFEEYEDKSHTFTIRPLTKRIKQLPSVNPQPCDDVISRILKRMWNCRGKHTTSIDKVAMEQIIRDELPSVTHKSGKWIKHNTGHSTYYSCSKCSCLAPNTEVADGVIWKLSKYCPDCGAKMESEEQE